MTPEEKKRQAKEWLRTVDWSTYDFRTAPGACLAAGR